eukprot:3123555-Amphidinium_carterae.1
MDDWKTILNLDAKGDVPLQGAQKNVHAPRHSAWQRIVTRPGIQVLCDGKTLSGVFFQPLLKAQ